MGHSHGKQWTEAAIESALSWYVSAFGRMPSVPELNALGAGQLANQACRTLGMRGWADRLGAEPKDSETRMGQRWEAYVFTMLVGEGFNVSRQTTKAEFDLLVNGSIRVNVKSARWNEYPTKTGVCSGYFFGIGKSWERCDLFALVADDGSESPRVLWVPAAEAQQQTITLTRRHRFNAMNDIRVFEALKQAS